MNKSVTIKHIISVLAVSFFIFLAFATVDEKAEGSTIENEPVASTESIKEQTPEELNQQLKREIESLNKPFDNSTYDGTVDALQLELVLFGVWANIIKEGEASTLEDNVKLAKELKNKVIKIQSKEFPLLRKKYGVLLADKMWEHDIIIKTTGSTNGILELTGGTFAANKNIKEFQTTLSEVLTMFRFKQTRYRWYKDADEYTYYDLGSESDKELVSFSK
jgi:hypothetical protein